MNMQVQEGLALTIVGLTLMVAFSGGLRRAAFSALARHMLRRGRVKWAFTLQRLGR